MPTQNVSAEIKTGLEKERATLLGQLSELGHGDNGRLEYDSNFADTSQVTAERGETDALAANLSDALDDVNLALEKLENGTYGICEKCDGEIAEARLEAVPTGRLCMDCASGR